MTEAGPRQRRGDLGRGRFADHSATFADQEYDRIGGAVVVHACDECIAACDAMHKPVRSQEFERAVGGDGRRPYVRGRQPLDDVIGAERLMAAKQDGQDLAADGGKPLTTLRAARLGNSHGVVEAPIMVMIGRGEGC